MSTFTVFPTGVDALLRSETGPVGQYLARVGNQIVNSAKGRANVDTGLMRSTITFKLVVEDGQLVGVVGAYTTYAIYVHELYNPFLADAMREVIG